MGYTTIKMACNGKGCQLHEICTNTEPHDLTTGCGHCVRSEQAECKEMSDGQSQKNTQN